MGEGILGTGIPADLSVQRLIPYAVLRSVATDGMNGGPDGTGMRLAMNEWATVETCILVRIKIGSP